MSSAMILYTDTVKYSKYIHDRRKLLFILNRFCPALKLSIIKGRQDLKKKISKFMYV